MKRVILPILLLTSVASLLFAQGWNFNHYSPMIVDPKTRRLYLYLFPTLTL